MNGSSGREGRSIIAKLVLGLAFPFAVCLAAPLFAAPMYLQYNSLGANDTFHVVYQPSGPGSGFDLNIHVGQLLATLSPNADLSGGTQFYTFCVDLNHTVVKTQEYQVNILPTSVGLTNGPQIAYLYDTFGIAQIPNPSGDDFAAALQLAIWDELVNNGQPPTVGSVLQYTATPAVDAQVQAFLNAANANAASAYWGNPTDPQPQGFTIGQGFIIPPNIVPEPSSLVLMALAATGFLALLRGKRSGV